MDRPVCLVDVRHLDTDIEVVLCMDGVVLRCNHLLPPHKSMLFYLLVYTVTCLLLVNIIILKLLNNIFGGGGQNSRRINKWRDELFLSAICFSGWLHMSSFQCVGSAGFSFLDL